MKQFKLAGFAAAAFALSLAITLAVGAQPVPARTGTLHADLLHSYESVADLTKNADLILVGRLVDTTQRPYGRLPFTLDTLQVERVIRGSSQTSTVRVLETGGLLPPSLVKGGNAALSTSTLMSFEGVAPMTIGEQYVVFLQHYQGPIAVDAYVVLSQYQGRFHVTGGSIHFDGDRSLINQRSFSIQLAFDGRAVVDLEADIASSN